MSVPAFDGHTCPHCMGASFAHHGWLDGDALGRIEQVVCIQCGTVYLAYTRDQREMMDEMDRRAEEDRERALRIAQEAEDAERRDFQLILWRASGGGVTLGWFRTREEAEECGRAYEHAESGDRMEVYECGTRWRSVAAWEVEA